MVEETMHTIFNTVCHFQILRHCRPRLLLRQFIQSFQRVRDVCSSHKPFHEFLFFQGKKISPSPCKALTDSSLLHLFRRKCKYGENLCHYLSEHRRHFRREWNPRIDMETCEERLDALKKIDEDTTARGDVFSYLKGTASEEQIIRIPRKDLPRGGR